MSAVPLGALYKVVFSCLKARIAYLREDCKETLLKTSHPEPFGMSLRAGSVKGLFA